MKRRNLLAILLLLIAVPVDVAQGQTVRRVYVPVRTYTYAYWGYVYDPYGLHGQADVIRARAQASVLEQEAASRREQVRQQRLETRRKELEFFQWEWEKKLASHEDRRTAVRQEQFRTSVVDPPASRIVSGEALNSLRRQLELNTPGLRDGVSTPLPQSALPHVNFTSVVSHGGSLAMLKGVQEWPELLHMPQFGAYRKDIEKLCADVKMKMAQGGGFAREVGALRRNLANLDTDFHEAFMRNKRNPEWSFDGHRSVRAFIIQCDETLKTLTKEGANSAVYLQTPEAATVADLILYMKGNGLSFAPATDSGGRWYAALHRAMAEECVRIGVRAQ